MGSSPSVKETTLHHYRDPLAACLANDAAVDFLGVVLQATSDSQQLKEFMALRAANMVSSMHPDGVLLCIDAWGNAHIDFCGLIEAIGRKKIPLIGLTFAGVQAAFVVTNDYMEDAILDLNKNAHGMENNVLADNTVTEREAALALARLKEKIRQRRHRAGRGLENAGAKGAAGPGHLLNHVRINRFQVQDVQEGEKTCLKDAVLYVNLRGAESRILQRAAEGDENLKGIKAIHFRIIRPGCHDFFVNSILDVSPIAVKSSGVLGRGVTQLLQGVEVLLCAVEEGGYQPINGGLASGQLKDVIKLGRCGSPAEDDFILHADVLLAGNAGHTRQGIMAAHYACDLLVEEIRGLLRGLKASAACGQDVLVDAVRPGRLRIALVKMTSGVSAMGDTAVFPNNPGGFIGAGSIIDRLGNFPLLLSPNEYRDGIVHSLT